MQYAAESSSAEWYKDVVIYQIHVRSFYDSNADGIGDFKGLIQKLDYIKFLGVSAIWLLPFYPSPLKDEGYDVADYTSINPIYGTLNDFKAFLKKAKGYNIRVITELVINHTSSEHPWFQRARLAKPGSKWRNFYTWSDTGQEFSEARVIFNHAERSNWTWDPVANAYYWHRFYTHQPDLNFESEEVQKEVFKVVDFWFGLGVDGLRLDAIPYLFQKEGTNCENLEETHGFLKKLNAHIQSKFEDKLLLAEANQWAEETVRYFGNNGDECQMAYHFPLLPQLYMAVQMADRRPIVDIIEQTPSIPDNCQWAIFLRNHDALALEMLTDEECDYMYRYYAEDKQMRINDGIRRRLAPLMKGDRRKIELLNALLLSLPGTPIIYYGDEIGMGDNIYLNDRDSVRTPMQWAPDLNAGFSKASPQQLYSPVVTDLEYHYQMINVELQQRNVTSLLWWMKRLLLLRGQYQAFGRGSIVFLQPDNPKVLAFYRIYQEETILVLANLSSNIQSTFIPLKDYIGHTLIEMLGKGEFPSISDSPYFFNLSPYSFMWFKIEEKVSSILPKKPLITLNTKLEELFSNKKIKYLESALANYFEETEEYCFVKKEILKLQVLDQILITSHPKPVYLLILEIEVKDKSLETYHFFLTDSQFTASEEALNDAKSIVCELHYHHINEQYKNTSSTYLIDATKDLNLWKALSWLVRAENYRKGEWGGIKVSIDPSLSVVLAEQTFGQLVLAEHDLFHSIIRVDGLRIKWFKRNEKGLHPEIEFQSIEANSFDFKIPKIFAKIEYHQGKEKIMLGVVQYYDIAYRPAADVLSEQLTTFIQNQEELILVSDHFEKIVISDTLPSTITHPYLGQIKALASGTAKMHLSLAKSFECSAFTLYDQRAFYQTLRTQFIWFQKNKQRLYDMDSSEKAYWEQLQALNYLNEDHIQPLLSDKFGGNKIRCHGGHHLNNFVVDKDRFILINTGGEASKPFSERRIKRSPLKDLASLLYSLYEHIDENYGDSSQYLLKQDHITYKIYEQVEKQFLTHYLENTAILGYLPHNRACFYFMFELFFMEKCIQEMQRGETKSFRERKVPLQALWFIKNRVDFGISKV